MVLEIDENKLDRIFSENLKDVVDDLTEKAKERIKVETKSADNAKD